MRKFSDFRQNNAIRRVNAIRQYFDFRQFNAIRQATKLNKQIYYMFLYHFYIHFSHCFFHFFGFGIGAEK